MSGLPRAGWVAWRVTFRRSSDLDSYKREDVIIVAPAGSLQMLLGNLRYDYEDVVIDRAEVIGDARVAS